MGSMTPHPLLARAAPQSGSPSPFLAPQMDTPSSSSSRATTPTPTGTTPNTPHPTLTASSIAPSPRKERQERHRKSLSASVVPETPRHRDRSRTLPAVDEDDAVRGPYAAVEDLRSLRSTGRRRMRALRDLECALAVACTGDQEDMAAYVSLQAHTPILALLGRHTASLAKRASTSSLPPGDELARHLGTEIDTALGILQGLTLLSRSCKAAVGERWTMEMFLDLLLLLRTQPAEGARPTVYALLDLLFCVLVDSPEHARRFEDLQGLEAVTRVLRGTGVAKDVRMKCCEFLYFYLLPEGSTTMPDAYSLPGLPGSRSSSASSTSSAVGGRSFTGESQDMTQSVLPSPSHSRVNSIDCTARPPTPERAGWNDLADLPFIPETPRKPAKPSLGFQTPSANRRTSGSSSVTVLTPVAQSPDERKRDEGSRTSSGSSSGSGSVAKGPRQLFKDRDAKDSPRDSPTPQRAPSVREVSTGLSRRPSKRSGKSPLGQSGTGTPDTPRRHARSQSASTASSMGISTPRDRQRSRGFPSKLTRGALPAPGAPLTPSRRIPSERERSGSVRKDGSGSVRSVAEKKEMLGAWLGNVDQLVSGVEKVGFWASKE